MADIHAIDKNFNLKCDLKQEGIRFYSIEEPPFSVHGVFKRDGIYRRMPEEAAARVSENVKAMHMLTAGGRVRFKTDSPYVAIHLVTTHIPHAEHFTLISMAGFDLYVRNGEKEYFSGCFIPPYHAKDGFDGILWFETPAPDGRYREVTINFPHYGEVIDLYIGLDEKAEVLPASPYRYGAPIVFYGHSITQGGCASRPGLVTSALISRRFHADVVNLGFSGSAKGEVAMAEYIAGLPMCAFVYDYDANSPNAEHLSATHEPMFKIIREAHPETPILLLTSTPRTTNLSGSRDARVAVIRKTYENALRAGDKNVYFVDGFLGMDDFDGPAGCTVEGCHLNDIGFKCLSEMIGGVLARVLPKE